MKISHGRTPSGDSRRGEGTFTGEVHQDPVVENRPAVAINDNFFAPGARSYWHSHENGQVLIVKAGKGHVQSRGGASEVIRPGDIIWADPGEVHWHGAGQSTYILHTAISLGTTHWHEEVSEADYASANDSGT